MRGGLDALVPALEGAAAATYAAWRPVELRLPAAQPAQEEASAGWDRPFGA